jgi:NAD(P)-dependent dehydrogenase (short-subunit alcohol dehydrogenase family)
MSNFKDKVVLITGGTSGIGFSAAKLFIDSGATVIVTGRNKDTLEAARKEFGDRAEVVESDSGDPEAIAALFAHVKKKYGGLDALYLNAGIATATPIAQVDVKHFDRIFDVNVKGPLLAIQHAAPIFSDGGAIVITTSVVNEKGMPGFGVYGASKAAVRHIVRTAAAELQPLGVRVNAVSPGPVETPIFGKMGIPQDQLEEMAKGMTAMVPMGRVGQPEEIAKAAVFLCSDDASFITGEELKVDGGTASL